MELVFESLTMAGGLSASRWSWRSKSTVNVPLRTQKQQAIHGNRWNLNPQTPDPLRTSHHRPRRAPLAKKKRNSKDKKDRAKESKGKIK